MAGRPRGRIDSPQDLLRRSMQDSARIGAKARKLLEERLDKPDLSTEDIIAILTVLDNSLKGTGTLLVPKGKSEEAPVEAATPEKILAEITKGKQQR